MTRTKSRRIRIVRTRVLNISITPAADGTGAALAAVEEVRRVAHPGAVADCASDTGVRRVGRKASANRTHDVVGCITRAGNVLAVGANAARRRSRDALEAIAVLRTHSCSGRISARETSRTRQLLRRTGRAVVWCNTSCFHGRGGAHEAKGALGLCDSASRTPAARGASNRLRRISAHISCLAGGLISGTLRAEAAASTRNLRRSVGTIRPDSAF